MLAVIETGSKQYLVEPGQTIQVELLGEGLETAQFEPLLVVDGDAVHVGTPRVAGALVSAKVAPEVHKSDKVQVLKYKAKKRQKTLRGHRQRYSLITIDKITTK